MPRPTIAALIAICTIPSILVPVLLYPGDSAAAAVPGDESTAISDAQAIMSVSNSYPDLFGGISYDSSSGKLRVYVTDTSASDVAVFNDVVPESELEFTKVMNSYASLMATEQAVHEDTDSLLASGVQLDYYAPDLLSNTLQIAISNPSPATTKILEDKFGSLITVVQGSKPVFTATRMSDTAPWNGGDFIAEGSLDGTCSSGPAMQNASTGSTYLMTAGHCFGLGANVINGSNDLCTPYCSGTRTLIGSVSAVSGAAQSDDAELIRTSSSALVWRGTTTRGQASSSKPVVSTNVCQSGAPDGEICPLAIMSTDGCAYLAWTTCGLAHALNVQGEDAGIGNGQGDSGGPVYTLNGSGNANIEGSVVGSLTEYATPCTAYTNIYRAYGPVVTRQCFKDLFFEDITDSAADLGVTVQIH